MILSYVSVPFHQEPLSFGLQILARYRTAKECLKGRCLWWRWQISHPGVCAWLSSRPCRTIESHSLKCSVAWRIKTSAAWPLSLSSLTYEDMRWSSPILPRSYLHPLVQSIGIREYHYCPRNQVGGRRRLLTILDGCHITVHPPNRRFDRAL